MMRRARAGLQLVVTLLAAPALAQVDFSGSWAPLFHEDQPERLPGPELGDYSGIPVNDAARLRADSYDADRISVVTEYQCRPHGGDYSMRGLANMRVDQVLDPLTQRLIAIELRMNFQEMERTIWLDGREHPPALAAHTFAGFSTGTWQGNMLDVVTTHLKPNYLRRNGLPRSDQATFTEHWVRHSEYLTVTTLIRDPAFLTEPLVRSQTWLLAPAQRLGRDVCVYVPELPGAPDYVPNHLPGTNPFLREVIDSYGLPEDGVRGGSDTLYPEYQRRMRLPDAIPLQCGRYCRCGEHNRGFCDVQ
jgi:hypothetical protein